LCSARHGGHQVTVTPLSWPDGPVRIAEPGPRILHSDGLRRGIQRRRHLIVSFTRTNKRKTVELRGFEPLTSCMPYKIYRIAMWLYQRFQSPDVAGCRPELLPGLLPVLLPCPGFSCAAPSVNLPRLCGIEFLVVSGLPASTSPSPGVAPHGIDLADEGNGRVIQQPSPAVPGRLQDDRNVSVGRPPVPLEQVRRIRLTLLRICGDSHSANSGLI
jgi:hypothetical protein